MMRFCQVLSLEYKLLLFASHNLAKDVCHLGDNVKKAECFPEVGFSWQINAQVKLGYLFLK